MPEYRKPPCMKTKKSFVGKGGNGKVYTTNNPIFVCKIFDVNNELSIEKRTRRYNRFCNEVQKQEELSQKMEGVLPVVEYNIPESYSKQQPAWFMMPKANPFFINNHKNLEEKLFDLIEIGNIISDLHSNNMAHRDIKPENILIYNNRLYLSDYGLLWTDGETRVTTTPEKIGPYKIIPPELENDEEVRDCDYRKSDVYLFAKVVWMYIKGDKNGFKGPYNIGSQQIYLDKNRFNCYSLEPIHEMMINATNDDWKKRCDISDCLRYLREQLDIACNRLSEEKKKNSIFRENIHLFEATTSPDAMIYDDTKKIQNLLEKLIPWTEFEFNNGLDCKILKPTKIRYFSGETMIFHEILPNGGYKRTMLNISSIKMTNKEIIFKTKMFNL